MLHNGYNAIPTLLPLANSPYHGHLHGGHHSLLCAQLVDKCSPLFPIERRESWSRRRLRLVGRDLRFPTARRGKARLEQLLSLLWHAFCVGQRKEDAPSGPTTRPIWQHHATLLFNLHGSLQQSAGLRPAQCPDNPLDLLSRPTLRFAQSVSDHPGHLRNRGLFLHLERGRRRLLYFVLLVHRPRFSRVGKPRNSTSRPSSASDLASCRSRVPRFSSSERVRTFSVTWRNLTRTCLICSSSARCASVSA